MWPLIWCQVAAREREVKENKEKKNMDAKKKFIQKKREQDQSAVPKLVHLEWLVQFGCVYVLG